MGKTKLKKNLANCTPREFLSQTNKIRKSVESWLKATDIMNIRKNVPVMKKLPPDASAEEIKESMDAYKKKAREQAMKNLHEILDAIMDKHPDETLELLALVNFVEPKELDNYSVAELLRNTTEVINDEDVISFFTSLARLEQISTLSV